MLTRRAPWTSFLLTVVTLVIAAAVLRAAWTIEVELCGNTRPTTHQYNQAKQHAKLRADDGDTIPLPQTAEPVPQVASDQKRTSQTNLSHPGADDSSRGELPRSDQDPVPLLDQTLCLPVVVNPRPTVHETADTEAPPIRKTPAVHESTSRRPRQPRVEATLDPALPVVLEVPRSTAAASIAVDHEHVADLPIIQVVADARAEAPRDDPEEMPGNYLPWWQQKISSSFRGDSQPQPVSVDALILGALRYSPRVRAVSNTPLIREAAITEAEARFDWRSFMDSRFSATSEPVGSTLTTGGPSRFREQNWRYNAGVRRTTETGGNFEVAQRIGYQDNNSVFFDPTQQGNARLSLSFTQPLLNGSGRAYNQSLIVLAQIDADMASDEFSKLLQDHLLEVTRAYWELYLQRALLLQKQRLLAQATAIHERLEHRRGVDALESQIVRAKAAVASRKAEIIRCEMTIRNSESKLRVLVNDPALLAGEQIELVPSESPARDLIEISLQDSLTAALEHRPEILQAAKNVRAASVRLGISEKELLPALDLITEAYVSGLRGQSDIGGALGDQFSEGQPSFSVGLVFEVPLHNRAAKARRQQRRLELQQLTYQLQQTTDTLRAEVEVAVRIVETAFREMHSKYRSMLAADAEVNYLSERWRVLPGEDQVASFLLEDLLDAQQRQATEEADFVTAQVNYTVALAELKRATGMLLEAESVSSTRTCSDGLPQMILDRQPATAPSN